MHALRDRYPEVSATHVDVLEYMNRVFVTTCVSTYSKLIHAFPTLWLAMYTSFEERNSDSRGKRATAAINRLSARRFLNYVADYDPDMVLCTHYVPAELLAPARRAKRLRAPLCVLLTDYEIHTMWLQDGVDRYFVATQEMAFALEAKGMGNARVDVTGIPTLPAFTANVPAVAELRKKLNLHPDRPTVLVAAGGYGVRGALPVVADLAKHLPDAQFLAVAGNNARLRAHLDEIAQSYPGRVFPFAYVDNMHELMAAADVMISKSGGLTTTECLVAGLPIIVYKPIPGHEERNARFLLEQGAGLWAHSAAQVVFKTSQLLKDTARLGRMKAAARRAGRPDAAGVIAGFLMDEAGERAPD